MHTCTALVLAGGAARGAYEVGVIRHVLEALPRDLGREIPLEILCGTSVGAINISVLAALADRGAARAESLAQRWSDLRIERVLKPDGCQVLALAAGMAGVRTRRRTRGATLGGILDPSGLERMLAEIPFARIEAHLQSRLLDTVAVSTTEVETGRTVVFVATDGRPLPLWHDDPTLVARTDIIGPSHALASAAIPPLFPAVRIGGQFYCDGGLRQNVPLAPALHLGATGMLVISPHHIPPEPPSAPVARERERDFSAPLFLVGKTLSALLLDRIDTDIDRTRQITAILEAATRRCGPGFVSDLNRELAATGRGPLRPVHIHLVRPSRSIAGMAAEFVRTQGFARRIKGVVGRVLRTLAESEGPSEADLLSYLLFDGEFARLLMDLGLADARAQHDELCSFFHQRLAADAAA
jgi:NTE family protein